jgi:solute carrier family 35 protein
MVNNIALFGHLNCSLASTSTAIILFNKWILSSYAFKFEAVMLLAHMISCVVFSEILRIAGYISYPPIKKDIILSVAPLSIVFVLNVVIGLVSLRVVNVPMFTTLRRLAGLCVIVLEWAILGIVPSTSKLNSLLVILFGAVIAGIGDLSFDLISYACVMINNMLTAGYLIAAKKLDKGKTVLNANGKVFYNSLVSIPWLLLLALFNGELVAVQQYEFLYTFDFQIAFLFSAVLAFLVNAATFWCTSATTPLTTSVTGQTKNILVTFLGMFLFGDVQPTALLLFGLLISIIGSIWYSYVEMSGTKTVSAQTSFSKGKLKANDKDDEDPESR